MARYNHAFTVAFTIESDHEAGEDVTSAMMKKGLERRIRDLDLNEEWQEAVGSPFDTFEVTT